MFVKHYHNEVNNFDCTQKTSKRHVIRWSNIPKTKNQQRITTTTKSANQTRNLTITSSRECARLGTRLWFVFKWRLHLCYFGSIWEELDPESHQRPVENVKIIKDNWKQSTSMTYEIFVKNQKNKKKCFG